MARTGSFGGFAFDPEVFTEMIQEKNTWSNVVMASGIVQEDQSIMDAIGEKGNVATIPFYKPLNATDDGMAALNNDGLTDNTPVEVSGGKQTCMLIQRMKAFKAKDFTKELTGADPLGDIASKVQDYYTQVWESELFNIAKAVLAVAKLKNHAYDATTSGITATTIYEAAQQAMGDAASSLGILIMHSKVFTDYQKLELVEYDKYTVGNAIKTEVTLPTIAGRPVKVTDRGTSTTTGSGTSAVTTYQTYMMGEGCFLSANKKNYEKPYYTDYDAQTAAGTERLFTKQGRVIHPNGVSFLADNVTGESPAFADLGKSANYDLRFNEKNVKMAVINSK